MATEIVRELVDGEWVTTYVSGGGGATPSLQDVLAVGNDGNQNGISNAGPIETGGANVDTDGGEVVTDGGSITVGAISNAANRGDVDIGSANDNYLSLAGNSVYIQGGSGGALVGDGGSNYVQARSDGVEIGAAVVKLVGALPTGDPGVAGQVWNSGGTLKISAGPPP